MTSKITKTTEPALPSSCSVCSVAAKGYNAFYDFGVSIDWYGAILICEDCAQNLAELLDLTKITRLETAVAEGEALIAELIEQKKALEHVVSAYLIPESVGSSGDSDGTVHNGSVQDESAASGESSDSDDDVPSTFS